MITCFGKDWFWFLGTTITEGQTQIELQQCMVAKPTSGTGQGRNPVCVKFCRDKLKRRILTQVFGAGTKVSGTPSGELSTNFFERTRQKHRKLLRRIPTLPDVQ